SAPLALPDPVHPRRPAPTDTRSWPPRGYLHRRKCAPGKCATTLAPEDPGSRRARRSSIARRPAWLGRRRDPAARPTRGHTKRGAGPDILSTLAGRTLPRRVDFSPRCAVRLLSTRR